MDVFMPLSDSFRVVDYETKHRFLRGEVKTALLLGGKTCTLCGGAICRTSEVVGAVGMHPSHKDTPDSPGASASFEREQGPFEKHGCSFFCVALATNNTSDDARVVVCFVEYGFDYGHSRTPLSTMPSPVVLVYTVTPAVMMGVCCTVLRLASVILREYVHASSLGTVAANVQSHVVGDGGLEFVSEPYVDVHSLHKTVEFCVSVVLCPLFNDTQLLAVKGVLQRVGEALLKHCSARPLVKPFVDDLVQGMDLLRHHVKNPTRQLVLQLQKNRVFAPTGAISVYATGGLGMCITRVPALARITGLCAQQLAAMFGPASAVPSMFVKCDREAVRKEWMCNKDLMQLLYAVRCFLYPTQCDFYAQEVAPLDKPHSMLAQMRFLSSFLEAVAPLDNCRNFDRSDTMLIVTRTL